MKPYYDEDGVTIYCCDNREVVGVVGRFDLLLTDPPYGIGFASDLHSCQRRRGVERMSWDEESGCSKTLEVAIGVSGRAIVWGGNYWELPVSGCWLAWVKPGAAPTFSAMELAWTNLERKSAWKQKSVKSSSLEGVGHPTQKPMAIMSWCLEVAGVEAGQSVFDPWMGSGTTLVAAKLNGLRAVGVEREEEYCEMAVRRLAQGVLITT